MSEIARGYVDHILLSEDRFFLEGWMLLPGVSFDSFRVTIDDVRRFEAEKLFLEHVAECFSFIDNAEPSGFRLDIPASSVELDRWTTIRVIGRAGGRDVAYVQTYYKKDFNLGLPTPPEELRERVTANRDVSTYWHNAARTMGEFLQYLPTETRVGHRLKLLDWGCGCGRVASLLLRHASSLDVHGCDVDGEAIAWCRRELSAHRFRKIDPYPPTPYADEEFELVIGCSVATHLTRDVQRQWVQELRRILKPGGMALVSVHGPFAASFQNPSVEILRRIEEEGIFDEMQDHALNGIVQAGYYKSVFQSPSYTRQNWSGYFEVENYVERAMGGFQDLVVLRKPLREAAE